MIRLDARDLADVVGGELMDPADAARVVDDVTIDSRSAGAGALFVPLVGMHADGHDFIPAAVAAGAAAHLRAAGRDAVQRPGAIVVDDPADALTGLAAWVRDEVDPLVIAVTGSAGKTTTKDLLAAAVGAGRPTAAAPGSFNNELGVPLTCCVLERTSEVLVAEVGARGRGHIASLMGILRPDVAVVTNVAAAHLEQFGDLDGVALAKGELVEALDGDGTAVLNADDPRVAAMAARCAGRVVTIGVTEPASWGAADIVLDGSARATFTVTRDGRPTGQRVDLPVPGLHHVSNALAALAAADAVGVDLAVAAPALQSASVSRWRGELHLAPSGARIVNDAYNANPASVAAALRSLAAMPATGSRWAVLGEMAELGPAATQAHLDVGRQAADAADVVVAIGAAAEGIAAGAQAAGGVRVVRCDGIDDAGELIAAEAGDGDVVWIKASRAVGLERLVAAVVGEETP